MKQLQSHGALRVRADMTARAPDRGAMRCGAGAIVQQMGDELANSRAALEASDKAPASCWRRVARAVTPLTAMRCYVETLSMPELNLDQATRDRFSRSSTRKLIAWSGSSAIWLDLRARGRRHGDDARERSGARAVRPRPVAARSRELTTR